MGPSVIFLNIFLSLFFLFFPPFPKEIIVFWMIMAFNSFDVENGIHPIKEQNYPLHRHKIALIYVRFFVNEDNS